MMFRTFLCVVAMVLLPALIVGQGCPQITPPAGGGDTGGGTGGGDTGGGDTGGGTGGGDTGGGAATVGNSGITGQYAGSSTCLICHTNKHTDWMGTLHAEALDTLEAIGQGSNPECIGCHTVGFGQEGGFVDRATTNDLAGVGCEDCHGPAKAHIQNVADKTLRPTINISAALCGQCHTDAHHPTFDEWSESGHAVIPEHVVSSFAAGSNLNSCGVCHSGDFFHESVLEGETVADDALAGLTAEEMTPITCIICHDPHEQTGNAVGATASNDKQLRFAQAVDVTPTNTEAAASDPTRFNLCGQCHHSRGKAWDTTSSYGPHHSVQSNVYFGEMPIPEGEDTLVTSVPAAHAFIEEQCTACHMHSEAAGPDSAAEPAITGHTFEVNDDACLACHLSTAAAESAESALHAEVQARLDAIAARLGDASTWEYASLGGPDDQSPISDDVKKIRFLYHYILNDGSFGVHNPIYVRSMLTKAEALLDGLGL